MAEVIRKGARGKSVRLPPERFRIHVLQVCMEGDQAHMMRKDLQLCAAARGFLFALPSSLADDLKAQP